MKDKLPGTALNNGLTDAQIIQLLDTLFATLSGQQLDTVIETLPADVGETVSAVLAGPDKSAADKTKSIAKYFEAWHQLWVQWADYVFEVGDEKGRYACKDNHWEPPYFDCHTLADDLDKVAKKMLPLIEKVALSGTEEPTCFTDAIDDMEINIGFYPDWMAPFDSEQVFVGPAVTSCLLTWERIHTDDMASFVARLVQIQQGLRSVLDGDGFADFFDQLTEQEQKEVYEVIQASRQQPFWKKQLASQWSNWHQVHHDLAHKFSKKTYLDNCAGMIDKDWRYGLPLVDDFLGRDEHKQAEEIIKQLFASFIRRKPPESWQPEKTLILNEFSYGYSGADPDICDIFEKWIMLAEKNRDTQLAAALKFQSGVYKSVQEWDKIAAMAQDLSSQTTEPVIHHLYDQWIKYIVTVTMGLGFHTNDKTGSCWLAWLLSCGLHKEPRVFINQTADWLADLKNNAAGKKKTWPETQVRFLRLLTRDILRSSAGTKKYPHLYSAVSSDSYQSASMEKIRWAWLDRMKAGTLFNDIIEVWKNNLANFVPEPALAQKANYSEHALWLSVAFELDRQTFKSILTSWQKKHHRRRNLWTAIKSRGLPIH